MRKIKETLDPQNIMVHPLALANRGAEHELFR